MFTMGRLRVVSRPTSSSKKSARCEIWKGTSPAPCSDPDLARTGEHLAGHEPGNEMSDERREGDTAVQQVVLVAAVGVALAVGVVLVDDDLLAGGENAPRGLHGTGQNPLARFVVTGQLEGTGALRGGELRVGVVHVVAGPVGEHGVDQMGLHLGGRGVLPGEAPGVASRRLVLEVPAHLAVFHVGIDQHRRGDHRIPVCAAAKGDAVLGFDPEHLGQGHGGQTTGTGMGQRSG